MLQRFSRDNLSAALNGALPKKNSEHVDFAGPRSSQG
jgi:hypothetical protein